MIAEKITEDFFSFEKLLDYGFTVIPPKGEVITISTDNLKKYLKSIHDKIKELESGS